MGTGSGFYDSEKMMVGECPHCHTTCRFIPIEQGNGAVHVQVDTNKPGPGFEDGFEEKTRTFQFFQCPNCREVVIWMLTWRGCEANRSLEVAYPTQSVKVANKVPASEVPPDLVRDYTEADACRPYSCCAAAALLRRCLQAALREQGFKASRLLDEIELAARDSRCSSLLRQKLHLVREVGNYAAHPTVDGAGGYLEVEPGEVEALFSALDEFFDAFYVKPKQHDRQLAAVNSKLAAANRKVIA